MSNFSQGGKNQDKGGKGKGKDSMNDGGFGTFWKWKKLSADTTNFDQNELILVKMLWKYGKTIKK